MEILLKNGLLFSGKNELPVEGDILIKDGYIAGIGRNLTSIGTVIRLDGLAVAPGFIDQHTHTDRTIFEVPSSASKVTQGVTSEITGNCGIGSFPTIESQRQPLLDYLDTLYSSKEEYPIHWSDFAGFAKAVDEVQPGVNILPLLAHGALRMVVMGTSERKPTKGEMDKMKKILEENLGQGAWGMSTGLVYPPGSFADTEELEELAKVLAKMDSVFTSHVRGESGTLLQADAEILGIGKRTGCEVVISHLKAIGKQYWGDGCKALHMINEARATGQKVFADQYPYEATNTALSVLAPEWAHDGGISGLMDRLTDPMVRPRLLKDIKGRIDTRGGGNCVQISNIRSEEGHRYLGKTLQDIANEEGRTPEEAAAELLLHEHGAVAATYFSLGKIDLETIMKCPMVSVCSDGFGMDTNHQEQSIHPRAYGTFTRVLGKYVREERLLPLHTAIWKMTGLPATAFQIPGRGFLKLGNHADITIFDPSTVRDCATYTHPHQYSKGIEYVFVNGIPEIERGELTGLRGGHVVKRSLLG